MDEKVFLRDLARASSELTGNIGDIRPEVWRRIRERESTAAAVLDVTERRWITRLDFAAAAVVIIGAGALYGWAVDLWSDMYWSGSFYMFDQYIQ